MLAPEQIEELDKPLNGKIVRKRKQGGMTLSYIEGWWAIKEANRIFGHDGWDRETVMLECVWSGERKTRNGDKPAASYIARVRVTVRDKEGQIVAVREGTGAGSGFGNDAGEAHESASKEAETDAMKRALMTFGNPFGLALYDKDQADVNKSGDWHGPLPKTKLIEEVRALYRDLRDCSTIDEYDARYGQATALIEQMEKDMPLEWEGPLQGDGRPWQDAFIELRDKLTQGPEPAGAPVLATPESPPAKAGTAGYVLTWHDGKVTEYPTAKAFLAGMSSALTANKGLWGIAENQNVLQRISDESLDQSRDVQDAVQRAIDTMETIAAGEPTGVD